MKIKIKITPAQYAELINVIEALDYNTVPITSIELINLKYFWREGKPKCTDFIFKKVPMNKKRAFAIDINHYAALQNVLCETGIKVSPYTQSIVMGLRIEAEQQINRAISGYRLVG